MSGPPPKTRSGVAAFQDELNPAVVDEVMGWGGHPELGPLQASLVAIGDRERFLDAWAEAMVARHLLLHGCELAVEVATPSGRTCDFRVRHGEAEFYLHVKRLNTDRPVTRRLSVSSRLRYLERIERPYVVSIRYRDGLSDAQMQRYVTAAAEFVRHARVGDELSIRDDDGSEIGGVRIVAPWQGRRVSLEIGLPWGFVDEAPRARRLLRKAYQQFMPGAANAILLCSSHAGDVEDFTTALLGSHIERWDAQPPEGRRVAHGRDVDGFWHGRRFPESTAAGWFHFRPELDALRCRLWMRSEQEPAGPVRRALLRLFDGAV